MSTSAQSDQHSDQSTAEIGDVVVKSLGELLYTEPAKLDRSASFDELGLDSVLAVEFTVRLSDAVGVSVQADKLYELGTPEKLISYLENESELRE